MSSMMSSTANCQGCRNPKPAPAGCCDVIQCEQCRLQLCKGQLSNVCCRCASVNEEAKSVRDKLASEVAKLEEMLLEIDDADKELAQQDDRLTDLKRRVVEDMEKKIARIRSDGKVLENQLEKLATDGAQKRRRIADLQMTRTLVEFMSRCKSWIEGSSADVVRKGEMWLNEAAGVVVTSRGRWSAARSRLDPVDFSPLKLEDWLPGDANVVGEILYPSQRSSISQHKTRPELQAMVEKMMENQRLLQSKLRECDQQQQLSKRQLESMSRRVEQLETVNRQQKRMVEDMESKEQDLTESRLKDAARIKEMERDMDRLNVSRHAAESRTREVSRLCQQLGSRLADTVELADQRAEDLDQYRSSDVTSTHDGVGIMTSSDDEMAGTDTAAATEKKWRENCEQHIKLIGETQSKLGLSYRLETELRREIMKLQQQQQQQQHHQQQQQQQQQGEEELDSDKTHDKSNSKCWMLFLCITMLALVVFFIIIWYQSMSVALVDPVSCHCPVNVSSSSDNQMLVNTNTTDQHFCSRTSQSSYCDDV